MLSRHAIGAWQCGQRERGVTIERSRGMRLIQTFRKLPNTSPMTNSAQANRSSKCYQSTSPAFQWEDGRLNVGSAQSPRHLYSNDKLPKLAA